MTIKNVSVNSLNGSAIVPQAPYRNLIINGAMQVAQRGTSVSSVTSGGYYTADRWRVTISSMGTWTQSVETDAPTGSGFRNSLKMLCTTADASPAAGDYALLAQRFEGQNLQSIKKGTSAAEQLTVSFWVKSNVTGTYVVSLYDGDNSRLTGKSYTISTSATWEKKTITFAADTTGAFDNDNADSLWMVFGLGSGSTRTSGTLNASWNTYSDANFFPGQVNVASATNNYWQITGVQLEVGNTATPFEFKPYEEELRQCMRYFEWTGYRTTNWNISSTSARCGFNWIVPKRTSPSVTLTGGFNQYGPGGQLSITSINDINSSSTSLLVTIVQSGGMTTNYPSTANIDLKVDAEL